MRSVSPPAGPWGVRHARGLGRGSGGALAAGREVLQGGWSRYPSSASTLFRDLRGAEHRQPKSHW